MAKTATKTTASSREKTKKTSTNRKSSAEAKVRKAIVATARQMSDSGLSPARSGNVSARFENGMLITPTGVAYADMKASDIVFVAGDGGLQENGKAPSSEWRFHLAIYQARDDLAAVVHTHSMHATVLACAHRPIPAFHYMVAVAGGDDIPLVPYSIFGSERLARDVGQAMQARDACLMANHGAIAAAASLDGALELAHEVETLAEQYFKVLAIGPPHYLLRSEMGEVLEKFQTYGHRGQKDDT